MAPDPSVIAAISASLEASPQNTALRLHLTDLLVQAGQHREALPHVAMVLTERPDDVDALRLAVLANDGTGDTARATGYRRLLEALIGLDGPPAAPPAEVPPADAPPETAPPTTDPTLPAPPPAPADHDHASPVTADGPAGRTAHLPTAHAAAGHHEQGEPDQPDQPDEFDEFDEFDVFLREVLDEHGIDVERPVVTLDHVGGLTDVKQQLQVSFLGPMRNPELLRTYGKSLRGGLLLYGPPGCGKTFIARALAGELGASFLAVGLHEVLDMWMGNSERNLHAIFETARRRAPCVVFLDEVDALGFKRSNLKHSAGRNVVVQLLTEMDGSRDDNEGVFVLGATNQPWDLDAALRRPGRFDRTVLVLPPDVEARRMILQHHLEGRPVAPDVDLANLARRTDGYSGADLRLVCEAAAEHGIAASIASGDVLPISRRQLEQAVKDVKPSTRPWFETARNYATFANQDGTYDDLLAYMRKNRLG